MDQLSRTRIHTSVLERRDEIISACRRYAVSRLDIFGSAARGDDFDPANSDADFIVDFAADAFADHYLDLKDALELILGRRVDLMDRRAIELSRNYIRRRHILSEARPFYVA